MLYYIPKEEILETTYNDIQYTKKYYKTGIVTGADDEGYPNWDSSTTYNVDEYVIVPELKSIYQSSADDNINNYPPATPSKWTYRGAVNSYKMFLQDEFLEDKTTGTDITIELDFSRCDAFALINTYFESVKIQQIDDETGDVVREIDVSGRDIGCLTFADYFYKDWDSTNRVIFNNFEWLPNSTLKIMFTGEVEIGTLVYGLTDELGCTLVGTGLTIDDASKFYTDEITGYRSVLRYATVRTLDVEVHIDANLFNKVVQVAEKIGGRNIMFIPTTEDKWSELLTLGWFKTFRIPIDNTVSLKYRTTVIGVT